MPIETNNLVLYKSERLTDTDDGGVNIQGKSLLMGRVITYSMMSLKWTVPWVACQCGKSFPP